MTTETLRPHRAGNSAPARPGGRAPHGPLAATRQADLDALERIAHRMDTLFRIPLTNIRVGLDSIVGLIPGVGDTAALLPAAYILYRAHQMGAPQPVLARMAGNVALDWFVGLIPIVGDLADVGFKANRRNVRLLRRHFERSAPA